MALTIDEWDRSEAVLDEFARLGGNAIDTAHVYGPNRHAAVGRYLSDHGRDRLIVMDKGCHPYGRPRVTRADMAEDIATDLERMGLDSLDFFVLHRDDPSVPAGEIVEWLNEHVSAGRIQAFGGSNWHHRRIKEANEYATGHKLQGLSASSSNLALAHPQEEMWAGAMAVDEEGRRWFEETHFPLFAWSAGAGGFFAGVESDDVKRVYFNPANLARKGRADELARKIGASPTQVAVAWVLHQPLNVFAIIGPRTVQEVRDGVAAIEIKLDEGQVRWLETG